MEAENLSKAEKNSTLDDNFYIKGRKIFLYKLFALLEENENPNIMCWTPDGEKFIIKDPTLTAKEILPKLFNHDKYSSFTRQLSFYRFKRISDKTGNRIYYHPYFVKGKKELLEKIERVKHKQSSKGVEDEVTSTGKKDSDSEKLKLLKRISTLTEQLEEARGTIRELELENDKLKLQIKQLTSSKDKRLSDLLEQNQLPQVPRYLDRTRFKSNQQSFFNHIVPSITGLENKEMTKILPIKPTPKISIDQQLKEQFAVKGQNLNHLLLAPQRPRFLMSKIVPKDTNEGERAVVGGGSRIPNSGEGGSNHRQMHEEEVYLQATGRLEQPFDLEDYFNAYADFHSSA